MNNDKIKKNLHLILNYIIIGGLSTLVVVGVLGAIYNLLLDL